MLMTTLASFDPKTFTNVPLDKTIDIVMNLFLNITNKVLGFSKKYSKSYWRWPLRMFHFGLANTVDSIYCVYLNKQVPNHQIQLWN